MNVYQSALVGTVPRGFCLMGMSLLGLYLAGCAHHPDRDVLRQRIESYYPEQASQVQGRSAVAGQAARPERATLLGAADLEAYVEFGLQQHSGLRAAFADWLGLTEQVSAKSGLPNPRLTYGHFVEEVQTRTGPQESSLAISQAFPWPGKRAAVADVAQGQADVAWQELLAMRLIVVRDIALAYHDYGLLGQELGITEELVELLHGLEPVVQGRIRAGAGQQDLLRLQVEIGRLEDRRSGLYARRRWLSARLAESMQWQGAQGVLLPWPKMQEPAAVQAVVLEDVLENSPRLEVMKSQVRTHEAAQGLERFKRRPDFQVGLQQIRTGSALNPGTQGSGEDPLLLSLSIGLPIWSDSNHAAEAGARQSVIAARMRLERLQVQVRADWEEQNYLAGDAGRRIELYRDSLLPRAEEALQLTLSSYRTGESTVLDLIDSEKALLEFELAYWRACRDVWQARARLESLRLDPRSLAAGNMPTQNTTTKPAPDRSHE